MSSDPWKSIERPRAADAINAFRIDEEDPWNFFWARDIGGRCLLVLKHSRDSSPAGHLPKLKGVEISAIPADADGIAMLVFRLLEAGQREIFHRLCLDIVGSAVGAASEKEAVAVSLNRTWRWHHLLRGGGDGRLSPEEQKGLIGELIVLERHVLPLFSAVDSVRAWHGPLGAPKDFGIDRVSIEAKARRGAATPYVAISSEHQLDGDGVDALYLHVVDLDQAASGGEGMSVTALAGAVREGIERKDPGAVDIFESLLLAAGFRWDDDYSDSLWLEGSSRLYSVAPGFPRIEARHLPSGVTHVKYAIALHECEPFLVAPEVLVAALEGVPDGK